MKDCHHLFGTKRKIVDWRLDLKGSRLLLGVGPHTNLRERPLTRRQIIGLRIVPNF